MLMGVTIAISSNYFRKFPWMVVFFVPSDGNPHRTGISIGRDKNLNPPVS
jgi:hypothetical protein